MHGVYETLDDLIVGDAAPRDAECFRVLDEHVVDEL
jgi:hypothetical protein